METGEYLTAARSLDEGGRRKKKPRLFIKRIVESISAISKKPLSECRILDLAPGEGASTVECALQGAHVTVVEAREENLDRIQAALDCYGKTNADLHLGDVREISESTHGRFDIILCCGILYHLNAEGVHTVIAEISRMVDGVAFFDTHVSVAPTEQVELGGETYHGHHYREFDEGTSEADKIAATYHSIDNETSFWFTRVSLVNMMLRHGFVSVNEVFNTPMPNRPDRCSFVAIQEEPTKVMTAPAGYEFDVWGEGTLDYGGTSSTEALKRLKKLERLENNPAVRLGIAGKNVLRRLMGK